MVMLILLITKQSPVTVIHPWRSSEMWENHLSSIIRMSGSQGIYRNPFLHHDTKHPRLARLPKPWIFVAHHSNHGKPGVLVHRSVGTAAKRHEFLPARLPWTSWQAQLHSLFDGKVTSFFRNQRFLRMERSPHTKKKQVPYFPKTSSYFTKLESFLNCWVILGYHSPQPVGRNPLLFSSQHSPVWMREVKISSRFANLNQKFASTMKQSHTWTNKCILGTQNGKDGPSFQSDLF